VLGARAALGHDPGMIPAHARHLDTLVMGLLRDEHDRA
jgi:hypothetical protein